MLTEFRLSNYKSFGNEILFPIGRSSIILGNCGSGKSSLGQAVAVLGAHYDRPPKQMEQEDFYQLCMETGIEMRYTFLFDAGRLVYRLQWTGSHRAPRQSIGSDDGILLRTEGLSVRKLAEHFDSQYRALGREWSEYVRQICFLKEPERAVGNSLLIVDNFAVNLDEDRLEEWLRYLKNGNRQLILLSSKAAMLDLKESAWNEYYVLDSGGLHPLADVTEKALGKQHNLRKLWRAGMFRPYP